jgi:Macrocin-O-methyltransferase (TylF)
MPNDSSSASKAPWPYRIGIPQRFSAKYPRYQQLGGLVDVAEDARAYAGEEPIRDVERFIFLSLAFDQIHKERLEGDFAELGVYQGSTAAVLARHARRLNRQIYLLDTYEGFDQQDFSGLDAGRRLAFTDTSLNAVQARVGTANATYIKGYFPQTANQLPDDGRYCLVHIDTDLYAPIMSGLEYFYPRMVPGGFLIIHDYGSLTWEGAEKAVDTFFADKPEGVIHIPDSSGSAVIRRQRPTSTGPTWIARRQILPEDIWHSAANGKLSNILTDGWSSPEPWGTWGVGPSHTIKLMTHSHTDRYISVDIDLHAFAWEEHTERQIDVFVNGQLFSLISVTKAKNFTSLSLQPLQTDDTQGLLTIEFRPRMVVAPKDVIPTIAEPRTLGVGLHRIRVRSIRGP